jgi:CRP/FNR family transcriptional regulator
MPTNNIFHSALAKAVDLSAQLKSYPADSVIFNEDSYIRSIPLIVKGSIKVMRTDEEGREILLYYIKPGESCIMSFLSGIHNDKSRVKGVVEEDAEILFIPMDKASQWIREFPEWSDFIFRLYHQRFEELLGVVNALAFQKLDVRLLRLLEQKVSLFQSKELAITHQQLADEIGTTREVVSRVLKQMENSGLIVLSRNKISLL